MSSKIELSNDEVVLLQVDNVAFHSEKQSGLSLLASSKHNGELTLTNKRINYAFITGTFRRTCESIDVLLDQIKIFDGLAQFKPVLRKEDVEHIYLVAYTCDADYEFDFYQHSKKDALLWLNTVNRTITGVEDYWTKEDVGAKDIVKSLRSAINSAAPIVSDFANAAKPIASVAETVASRKAPVATGILGAVAGAFLSNNEESESQIDDASVAQNQNVALSSSLDEQIEAVQKVKELFDAGILSEEEFESKKKQIMGL